MNYQSNQISTRMGLEEALNTFSGEICYLTLKDGTTIEIIPKNQIEFGYTDNQLENKDQFNYNDEFVEENIEDNYNNINYEQIISNQPTQLRGRGPNKKMAKSLRKTVLKSLDGKDKEKQFKNKGKLRNLNDKLIYQHTENNDFLQCAHCLKFFPADDNEKDNENNKDSFNQIIPNKQQIPSQSQPNQFIPQNNPKNQFIPSNQQKMPMKQPMGIPQNLNHSKQSHNQIPKNEPKHQYQQVLPQQQKRGQNKKIPIGINSPQMPNQFRGQFPVFRARKKVSNRYESNNDRYFNQKNNTMLNNINTGGGNYYYPASGKKQRREYKLCEECSSHKKMQQNASYGNLNVARNLNYGFNDSNQGERYADNNLFDYMNNNNEYYEYPYNYQRKIVIPSGIKKGNSHEIISVKRVENQYPDYEYY